MTTIQFCNLFFLLQFFREWYSLFNLFYECLPVWFSIAPSRQ
ncbi:hypothetical protein NI35_3820 [Salmonella enterica subsp. enterica serovar Cerro]|nr:hypothetical protein STBHUCCB_110 [Salmonella enterica subsp. enterica serovar Typhi str. P-stx-12]APT80428.1 hypothetical protein GW13_PRO3556 [Salmonella enterica subsp. enterica serovar Cerro]AXR56956.1 hypothetical protein CJP42_1031 [Salmonella enterica subsp. enterica serovar Typhi]KMN28585.1 hypothetical protein NI35_3820 [Salmonella enterica subsp. enterica serovar Cerro]